LPSIASNWESDVLNWKFNKNRQSYLVKKIKTKSNFDFLVTKLNFGWLNTFHITDLVEIKKFKEFLRSLKSVRFGENSICLSILIFASCVFALAAEN